MIDAARQHDLLDQALDLSRQMMALGQDDSWAGVVELEPRRRDLLQEAFADSKATDEFVASRIQEILLLDKELIALSERAKREAAEELGQIQKARKIAKAYQAQES